jgi:hypothetical protein
MPSFCTASVVDLHLHDLQHSEWNKDGKDGMQLSFRLCPSTAFRPAAHQSTSYLGTYSRYISK